MNTSIKNRNESYKLSLPDIPKSRMIVYKAIKHHQPCTADFVKNHLGLSTENVVGRITELKDDYCLLKEHPEPEFEVSTKRNRTRYLAVPFTYAVELVEGKIAEWQFEYSELEDIFYKTDNTKVKEVIGKEMSKIQRKLNRMKTP